MPRLNHPSRLGSVKSCGSSVSRALLEGVVKIPLGPEARYQQAEAISLASSPLSGPAGSKRAALILREVTHHAKSPTCSTRRSNRSTLP
jgi:hypothetical protein